MFNSLNLGKSKLKFLTQPCLVDLILMGVPHSPGRSYFLILKDLENRLACECGENFRAYRYLQ